MKNINVYELVMKRQLPLLMIGVLVFALIASTFFLGHTSASQLSARSIEMNDSGASTGTYTGIGSGTNVIYKVQFSFPTTTAIAGVAIDFCTNSALPGDTCTAPTGFNVNRSTTTIATQTGLGTGAMAIKTASETLNNRIIITRASPATVATGTPAVIEFGTGAATNGFTNPSTNGTFYARIYTYTTQAGANGHNTAAATGYLDFGGVALSIADVITITARVAETLIFCVSAASPTSNCGGATTPAVTIGHGTVKFLDSSQIDTGVVYTQLSTNAVSGAIVKMRNANGTCGGLSTNGGTTCGIPPVNSGAATAPASAMTAGTAAFGLTVAAGTGGTGTVSPIAPYANVTANFYGMDSTSASNNVTIGYGSPVISCSGPVNNVNNTWTFAATASNVTPAGVYSANIALIATGTF